MATTRHPSGTSRAMVASEVQTHEARMKIAALLFLIAVSTQTRAHEKRYSLRGQVIDGMNGHPVTDVELMLQTADWNPASAPITPGAEGRFVFRELAAGEYVLSAASNHLGSQFYGELPEPSG